MKRCLTAALFSLAFSLLLPLAARALHLVAAAVPETAALPSPRPDGPATTTPEETPGPGEEPLAAPGTTPARADETTVFTVLTAEGRVETVNMAEYLPGVLAGEMPASFQADALRAQAVAARTYILCRARQASAAHPQADICSDPGCCQAWLSPEERRALWGADYDRFAAAIQSAVTDTDGVYISWEDEPILACFHSSSAVCTESSEAVWSGALPYLVSVSTPETPEDVPNYITTRELSAEEFRSAVRCLAPDANLSGDAEQWITAVEKDDSGRTESVTVGGARLTGAQLRELFALRSTAFTLRWTGASFLFTVTGYGHGVGMSQYGANVMAAQGSTWQEILAHYYPTTSLAVLS